MINIIVADDHELIHKGLRMMVDPYEHLKIAAEATSFHALLDQLENGHFDLLILDLNLGDMNGLETIGMVSNAYPELPILVLSSFPEDKYAVHAFKAGASGYLNKSVFSPELLTAIEKVAGGKKYISESLSENLIYGLSLEKNDQDPDKLLSKREFEVLTLMCAGKTYNEIASELNLSPKTVSTYRTRILEKLNLSNTAQLLRYTYEHQICNP